MTKFPVGVLPLFPNLSFETALWKKGIKYIAGVDEVGRGALAGPVTAAAVILPMTHNLGSQLEGVRDSKMMTPKSRDYWVEKIKRLAVCFHIGFSSNTEIDELGILPATILAMKRALAGLTVSPQHILIDYIKLSDFSYPYTSLVKGDIRCLSIAASSVLAKTARDALLCQLDDRFPGYGFAQNKGYGTEAHRRALILLGQSPIHRKSFDFKRPNPT
jgi:ribonuclease HII